MVKHSLNEASDLYEQVKLVQLQSIYNQCTPMGISYIISVWSVLLYHISICTTAITDFDQLMAVGHMPF